VQGKGRLQEVASFTSYNRFRAAHREWLEAALRDGGAVREGKWTESIAAGSEEFAKRVKEGLGARTRGGRSLPPLTSVIFASDGLGMAMILAPEMTILDSKTNTSGACSWRDWKDSLARPAMDRWTMADEEGN
jgi:hypothetical protein